MNQSSKHNEALDKQARELIKSINITTFLTKFFGLSVQEQLSHIGSVMTVPAGTLFYRARVLTQGENPFSPGTWGPPPIEKRTIGRFNHADQSVLYVASSDVWLPREINVGIGECYYVAEYEAINDFTVLTLLKKNDLVNTILHIVAMSLSKEDVLLPEDERIVSNLSRRISSVCDYIPAGGTFFIRDELYDLYHWTNKIFDLALHLNKNGIRYCSAYTPIEVSGGDRVLTMAGAQNGNYALTNAGIENIRFLSARKERYNGDPPLISIFLNRVFYQ